MTLSPSSVIALTTNGARAGLMFTTKALANRSLVFLEDLIAVCIMAVNRAEKVEPIGLLVAVADEKGGGGDGFNYRVQVRI